MIRRRFGEQLMHGPGRGAGLARLVLLGAIAFVNALAAVIVFPLAPFLALGFAVPAQETALTSVIFSAAAGLGGLAGALFLGRAALWRVAVGALTGLGLGSLAAALAPNFTMLLAARAFTGFCAAPLLAAVFAIIPETVPEARRNRALSLVVGSYGLALVLGLPASLLLAASAAGWRAAFLGMAGLCLALLAACHPRFGLLLGGTAAGRAMSVRPQSILALLRRPESLTGLALIGSASFSTLLISPHIGTFALRNAGLQEAGLWAVYLIGGGLALVTTRTTGWAMDRIGALAASVAVAVSLTLLLLLAFTGGGPWGPAAPLLGLLLAAQLARSTVAQASAAQVANHADRLTYQCLIATGTSLAQAAGAGCSALLAREGSDGRLSGMFGLAALSMAAAWAAPLLLLLLRRQLRLRSETTKRQHIF
jgi:predicted MFS family arabinose efflux permease